ncbi:MAG: hypothetical protein H7Y31_03610 [Chitinophagaceae bacterium]|nr:hypothetical protein [Chitinophagaceae bacterium]
MKQQFAGMWMAKKYYLLIALYGICFQTSLKAQPIPPDTAFQEVSQMNLPDSVVARKNSSAPFAIAAIHIEGNKRTKPYIVARELPFRLGDSVYLPDLVQGFEVARQQLMNTALFNEVVVSLKGFRGYAVEILIEVKERWYVFPIPYVKAVDRNMQEFIKQGLGVDRLNYGFKFNYNNFTGRNDKLRLWLITGYTKQIQFEYDQPYADKSLKHGYRVGFLYSSNNEINYATVGNEQKFADTLGRIKRVYAHVDYTYRPGLRTFNSVRIALVQQEVDSQILALNPKYFASAKTKITYPEISYNLNYYNVDYRPYPLTGWMGEFNFLKRGFGGELDMWQIGGKYTRSNKISKKMYYAWQTQGVLRVPFDQPFVNQRMLGYGEQYLRGLEDYVVDGVAALLVRQTLRREIIKFNLRTHLKSRSHSSIPFKFYAKIFGDYGYVHNPMNPENSLTNRNLFTVGGGFDMVTFYDFILRVDYSFNQLGQNGLFLRVKGEF